MNIFKNSNKRFSTQPQGHINTQEMQRVIRSHSVEPISEVMRVVVNYRKRQKQLKNIDLHLKSTLARSPISDRIYSEKTLIASPSKHMGVTKVSSVLLFVQLDKIFLEVSREDKETYFFEKFRQ